MEPHSFSPRAGTSAGPQQPSAGTGNHSASVLSAAVGHRDQGAGAVEGQLHNTHKKPNTHVRVCIRELLLKSSKAAAPQAHSCSMFKQLPEFRNTRSKYFHLLLCYSRKSHFTFRQIFSG